jgi:acyl-CoA synthetase (AMP-forming)/AMP-acid ligase II
MNVVELLKDHAEQHPNDVALIDRHHGAVRRTTFGRLEELAGRTAALLSQSGLRAGDTVLVFHPMSSELYVALGALWRLGLVAMFIDPSAGRRYIDRCCRMHFPRAMIAGRKAHLLRLVSRELRRIPLKFSLDGRVPGAVSLAHAEQLDCLGSVSPCPVDAPALISFTSGSTGEPKAALRTHGFLRAQHRAIEQNLGLTPGQIELVTLPIFVLANLASRVTSVIPAVDLRRPDTIDPAPVAAQISQHGVTRVAAPPAFYQRLAEYCESRGIVFPSLIKVLTGGGPVSSRLLDRLQRIAPSAAVTIVYGCTEAEPIAHVSTAEMRSGNGSAVGEAHGLPVGTPVPAIRLRILADRWGRAIGPYDAAGFDAVCQPQGKAGEVVVSGDYVLSRYLHSNSNEENKFSVNGIGWHRTGDAGYLDDQGRLWLLGPCAARVEDHRGAVYPLPVEDAAMRHDGVRRAAFLAHRGQRVLVVELQNRAAQPQMGALLKSLAFAHVDSIRVVKRLPVDRRHNTKVDYGAVRKLLSSSARLFG